MILSGDTFSDMMRDFEDRSARDKSLRLKQAEVKSLAQMTAELHALRQEVALTKQELADYKAQQAKQREADAVQAKLDRNKVFRHEYRVAGFTILFTFLAERICDLAQLDKILLQWVTSFFH